MSTRVDEVEPSTSPTAGDRHLQLLGDFALHTHAPTVELPVRAQRLLALLALHGHRSTRGSIAGLLWPDVPTDRANASLRTTLWGFSRWPDPPVHIDGTALILDPRITVDLHVASATATQLVTADLRSGAPAETIERDAMPLLVHDLLPGWSDDWLVVDREQFRQLRLHALEGLAVRRAQAGRYANAIAAAMAAIAAEPLRESAHRLLMQIYLDEGNRCEAIRQYHAYARLSRREMGVGPTEAMESIFAAALVEPERPARSTSRRGTLRPTTA